MKPEKYSLFFITGTLLYEEPMIIGELYLEFQSWHAVRQEVISKNLLQV